MIEKIKNFLDVNTRLNKKDYFIPWLLFTIIASTPRAFVKQGDIESAQFLFFASLVILPFFIAATIRRINDNGDNGVMLITILAVCLAGYTLFKNYSVIVFLATLSQLLSGVGLLLFLFPSYEK